MSAADETRTDDLSLGDVREVRATFATPGQMQDGVNRLSMNGFDRADLALPAPDDRPGPDGGAKPASSGQDAGQARTLTTSMAAAAAGMAAAGVTIATGGAAAPAIGAAVAAGAGAGAAAHALGSGASDAEQADRETKAANGALVLSVRTGNATKRADAEAILRAAGAIAIEVRG